MENIEPMDNTLVHIPSSDTLTSGMIECACGNTIHSSMDMCGDCMEDEMFFVGRGQRVFVQARRNFNFGF